MSGIFGICIGNFDRGKELDISPMFSWNRPYGGDGEGMYRGDVFSFGCTMQKLSESHPQKEPVLHYKSKHAVIDAVIYNRGELIERCGCEKDVSDPELLLLFVDRFGAAAILDVNGDFAGAIYDEEKRRLTLLRDHIGIRPLFYYMDDDCVVFSSDLRGLIANKNVRTAVSEEWIYRTVAGFDADTIDNTPYESIRCVTPSHFVEISFDKGRCIEKACRYWRLGKKKIRLSSKEEYSKRLRELVEDSVKRRLDAVSGLVGAELSGGLDSGVIDILINRFGRKAVYFSWSVDPDELEMAESDERLIISDICSQENITCNYMHLSADFSDKVAKKMDDAGLVIPGDGSVDFRFALPADSNTFTLMHGSFFAAENGARVMFTGHGGDEGISHRSDIYEMFYHHEYYHYLRHIWSVTGKRHRVLRTLKRTVRNISTSARENRGPYNSWYASPELLNKSFADMYKNKKQRNMQFSYDAIAYIENGGSRNRLDNMALLGAFSGIRYMVPYMDYRVIDFAVSIPRYLYINGKTRRYIFREAFKDIMPESLYKLNNKEETSFRNLPGKDDWYDEHARRKHEIIDGLDRDYWKKYLDFDKIDRLYNSGRPSEDEYISELRWEKALLKCALSQNLIDRAKAAK